MVRQLGESISNKAHWLLKAAGNRVKVYPIGTIGNEKKPATHRKYIQQGRLATKNSRQLIKSISNKVYWVLKATGNQAKVYPIRPIGYGKQPPTKRSPIQ